MAHLGTKTSDGQLSFDKYITNNPKWSTAMKFVVEHGVKQAPVVGIKQNKPVESGIIINGGQSIHIMSKVIKTLGKSKYAKIRIAGSTGIGGYLKLSYIRKPTSTDVMKSEKTAINDLDRMIHAANAPIDVVIPGTSKKYKHITEVRNIGGTPKADFALFDKYGVPQLWISHKKEGGSESFQQYSGISVASGVGIYYHKETQNFMRSVVGHIEGEHKNDAENNNAINFIKTLDNATIENKSKVAHELIKIGFRNQSYQINRMPISEYKKFLSHFQLDRGDIISITSKLSNPVFSRIGDSMLKKSSIFGSGSMHGSKFGENNVQVVGQGRPQLNPIDNDATFELQFSSKTATDIGAFDGTDYEPVFVATYRSGRKFTVDGTTYYGARLGIAPYGMVKNRKNLKQV